MIKLTNELIDIKVQEDNPIHELLKLMIGKTLSVESSSPIVLPTRTEVSKYNDTPIEEVIESRSEGDINVNTVSSELTKSVYVDVHDLEQLIRGLFTADNDENNTTTCAELLISHAEFIFNKFTHSNSVEMSLDKSSDTVAVIVKDGNYFTLPMSRVVSK